MMRNARLPWQQTRGCRNYIMEFSTPFSLWVLVPSGSNYCRKDERGGGVKKDKTKEMPKRKQFLLDVLYYIIGIF